MTIAISGTTGITLAGQFDSASTFGFKNRIINGAMVIDQRNAGAAVTPTTSNNVYPLDRFVTYASVASKYTAQQNAGSVTPPTGFSKYLGFTSSSAYSVLAGDYFLTAQRIEGFNFSDMEWGTANAATVTLSFWVRSSLTGTFGGALRNSANTRFYPFSYTISSANTWEQKTITIAGDTSGTWVGATNGIGVEILWSLGTGTTASGTAGSWSGTTYYSVTGATSVVGTNGATFYITGVQLEKGSTATSFDYRPFTTELQLAQRYYYKVKADAASKVFGIGQVYASTAALILVPYKVTLRTVPTALEQTGTAGDYRVFNSTLGAVVCSSVPLFNTATDESATVAFTVASGITAGNATVGASVNSSAYLAWSAEL